MPLHELLLEAHRQQNEEVGQAISNPHSSGKNADDYVFSSNHHYEEVKARRHSTIEPRTKVRLVSSSRSVGSNKISIKDRECVTDYMSSSPASSLDSDRSIEKVYMNDKGILFTAHPNITNHREQDTHFVTTTHGSHPRVSEEGKPSVFKSRRRFCKERQHSYSHYKSPKTRASLKRRKTWSQLMGTEFNVPLTVNLGMSFANLIISE